MKLISCHIENFGILSNEDYSFDPGLNIILRDNGSGKSTLAAFIRVMLFGFENAKVKNEIGNERRRYEPWQGGIYGGSLKFEAAGHEYILERTFGKTPKTDKFSLRDGETNLESRDYSPQVGQELFGMDSASFMRTVFISQNGCSTSATDSINARLGSLTDQNGDMESFDRADAMLGDLLTGLKSSRKVGELDRLTAEISNLENSMRSGEGIDAALQSKASVLDSKTKALNETENRQAALRAEQDRAEAINRLVELREKYNDLLDKCESRKKEFEKTSSAFPSSPPTEDELRRTEAAREQLLKLEAEEAKITLSDDEKVRLKGIEESFANDVPSPEIFEEKIDLWKQMSDLRAQADSLRGEIGVSAGSEKRPLFPVLIFGLILISVGAALTVLGHTWGLAISAAGIAAVVSAFSPMIKFGKAPKDAEGLKSRLSQAEASATEKESELYAFTDSLNLDRGSIPAALYDLKAKAENYRSLSEKRRIARERSNAAEISRLRSDIDGFTEKYCLKTDSENSMMDIRRRLSDFIHARDEYENIRLELENFKKNEDIDAVMSVNVTDRANTRALIDELRKISDKKNAIEQDISVLRRELEALRENKDKIDGDAEKLSEKREKLALGEQRYRIAGEARSMLRQAKENMVARYIGPLTEGFRKYYSLMGGTSPEFYDLDADIVLGVREAGLRRTIDFLSPGKQDLAGICLRMALIDAMYSNEEPFVIFDDPFVNLDEIRTSGALGFLEKLGGRRQIIYFTCHPSRTN